MTNTNPDVFDTTVQETNTWLRDIGEILGDNDRQHAYLALRGTLHALRDQLPIDESAQLSAQLPMLVRGIYFEGWNPGPAPPRGESRERFLDRVDQEVERTRWATFDPEKEARAVLRVLADRVSAGEVQQVRRLMPEQVRELWPEIAESR
ncbi:MAG: DUF2267 domain-containing protein [Thermomicrobiales bacterium]|nr:DUF2267 domain-containing protein [Thermomicrobiales bacterium]